ncbi:3-hydroxyacyl-CoA dehydrogenase family protein [Hymenobacter volaticus]|uniref:3-hydroxyacyl-CoA dehydrogenase family protein n=1 Tax=Hymenobacter volaticus TaxID=2932254 RepID=A0ABY4G6E1_9BACT|nr:3-hydroxyacyl-CoA dehydrogenase family protein [Hymenobacter volaticus]UOQ66337.1 3-hydroxyacyl-CoA dehydrogenase family protein [Hymenobacter volaticus]
MHLLIVEGTHIEAELRRKFGTSHTYDFCPAAAPDLRTRLSAADVGFDLRPWPELHYEQPRQPLFYDTSRASLAALFHKEEPPFGPVFGVCAFPTLLDREVLETSLYRLEDAALLASTCATLGTAYCAVQDQVGLVTPRMVCVLINEACYALQEGSTSVQSLNITLQLGPAHPRGPFEWANQIGVARVFETLEALWQDTHEERYKACALLKTMYLRGSQFELQPL